MQRNAQVGKLDRSKWEQKPTAAAATTEADGGAADLQPVAEEGSGQAGQDGAGAAAPGPDDGEEWTSAFAAAAPAARVIGKLDMSKFGKGAEDDDSGASSGGGAGYAYERHPVLAPTTVGKLDMSKFASVKK